MNDKLLDQIYNLITYTTTGICFLAASFYIIRATIMTLEGWNGITEQLYGAGLLLVMGVGMSLFIFYLKSWGENR